MTGMSNVEEAAVLDARYDVSGLYIGLLTTVPSSGDTDVSCTGARSGSATVTITTAVAHGYSNGDSVTIGGMSVAAYNGTFTIGGVTATTFTYTAGSSATDTATGGQASKHVEVPFTNAYARVALASTDWNAAVQSASSYTTKTGPKTGVTWQFPTATGSWGTIAGFGIFDAATGGKLKHTGILSTSKSVTTSDTPQFDSSNQVTLKLGDPADWGGSGN